jgi:CDP-glucose 4,6-dehydratase
MSDMSFWAGKRVFLTGHTGFKGTWLSLWLYHLGAKVTGYALEAPTNPSLFALTKAARRVDDIRGDILDSDSLKRALAKVRPEIIIHMAAQPIVRLSYQDPPGTFAANVMGTVNLLDAARACDSVRVILNITTDKVYDNREWYWGYRENEMLGGFDPYSASKACSEIVTASYRASFFNPEAYGKSHSVAIASARAGNVIGGGDWAADRLIPDFVRAIESHERIRIRNPSAVRPWQYVLEPLSGYLALCEKLYDEGAQFSSAWNFGPDDSDARSVEWIVRKLCSSWPGNAGFEIDEGPHPHEAGYLKLDCSKAKTLLGWAPRWDLGKALSMIIGWNVGFSGGRDPEELCMQQIAEYEVTSGLRT